jgi:hypothetical protein
MSHNLTSRMHGLLGAAGLFLLGSAAAVGTFAAVRTPAVSPAAPAVAVAEPAGLSGTLDDAMLTAADLGLADRAANGAAAATRTAGRPIGLLRMLVGRTERAEITVSTDAGTRTLLYVRGEITSLSASSVTVTLTDGTRASFSIDAATRVREKGKDIKPTDLSTGDRAMVFGLKDADGSYTARLIRCVREGARRAPASSPAASPPG